MRIPNILPMLLLAFSMSLAAQNGPCQIFDLTAQVVDCVDDEFYVTINFHHENTSNDGFVVNGNNGVSYGNFSYDDLPVVIGPLAADGTTSYGFLVQDLGSPTCAADIGLGTVTCSTTSPCEIYDLVIETGPCNNDGTYVVQINFKVENPTNDHFDLWGNNQFLGFFSLSDLPLKIDNFPGNGSLSGVVKVCINDNPDCCRIKEFDAPDCSQTNPCEISNVTIETGGCQPGGLYKLLLDFDVVNPGNDFFEVWAGNGQYLGHFALSQLPLGLPFPWGGGPVDKIRICINDNPNCCEVVEFAAPTCFDPCRIANLVVETGDCTSDSTYEISVKFQLPANSPVDSFGLWAANGDFLGRFAVADMPIKLTNFPWGGGNIDGIRVCISNNCCREKEFNVPECLAPPCAIDDLKVDVGGCTSPKTYKLALKFSVASTTPAPLKFGVWADNGDSLGIFSTADLPIGINFPWNGDQVDALKVCLYDADGEIICCKIIEFDAPDCVGLDCGIFNLEVKTGDCLSNGTYEAWINFQTPANSPDKFGIWTGTGKFLGFHSINDLPIYIKNFPASGGTTDKIIICFGNACCATKEFNAPDCIGQQPCGLDDLTVKVGDCTSDHTYEVVINFNLVGPAPGIVVPFRVFAANGDLLGTFNTSDLPLTISDFPWNGNAIDAVKICIGTASNVVCCRVKEFKAPDCLGAPCNIFNLKVETGDCHNDGTYEIWINFQTTAALGAFGVWAGNGDFLGVYSISDLPIHITNFPASGQSTDEVKVCLVTTAGTPPCCREKKFDAPDCSDPCGIDDLIVKTGDCTSDETYELRINMKVNNPSNTTMFAVYANGDLYGVFPLSDLPLTIPDFPWNGGQNDVVKICLVTPNTVLCCETVEFKVPDCLQNGPCEIYDLKVDPGACTSDHTYKLYLNFKVQNPGSATHFGVWANGTLIGTYALADLPLTIQDFPWGGGPEDVVKICLVTSNVPTPNNSLCCVTKEFQVPNCLKHQCEIDDLKVETGDCNADGTYEVWINFKVNNPPASSTHFGVWANGQLLGFFPLTQLPLHISNFPTNGGPNDVVKICLSNTGSVGCCAVKEFPVPDCLGDDCKIFDVVVETGDCHNDGTYTIKVNFEVVHPGNDFFELWTGNGTYLGHFPLNQLPLVIEHFPASGNAVDVLKICINDNPNCCKFVEIAAPDCAIGPCEIFDVVVQTGDCHDDGTYTIKVNFEVVQPGNDFFELWSGNGTYLGYFPLNQLPLVIEHFPASGNVEDKLRICINDNPNCCKVVEFAAPDCVMGDCQIIDLEVKTGDCNADGTYEAWVDFKVSNNTPAGLFFGVWANGQFLGSFPLTDLPFYIQSFPTNVGPNDVIKVCVVTPNATQPLCCKTIEFPVPDCQGGDCKIWDMAVQTTPCLCGQFFAIVTFEHKNGGSDGFEIVGNGMNYGNFPYNQQQPIILGPLDGDGTTQYEFVVRDVVHPDCHDVVELGTVDCSDQFQPSGANSLLNAGKLVLSPNPTSNWLAVSAQFNTGVVAGQATVEIRQADGRLLRSVVVPNASNFQLDVSELQAGLYRLSLQTAEARLERTFAKQ